MNADDQIAAAKAGAVDPLVALLRTGTDDVKEQAAWALANLAFENADNQVAIAKAGAVESLVALVPQLLLRPRHLKQRRHLHLLPGP